MELHMFMELSCREEGRGQDKWWDWKRRSRHTSTYIQNLKLLRVEGIGGEIGTYTEKRNERRFC
ncbi:hypothetical protein TRIUR3_22062 [Triticum urartu]|uniref:Uncharacterized protein n=1 Tax=Triticum urartu TaxID=4572 RepID=M8AMF6_TRIUA|nr:hypothetical protein TRIUR3_22062 [Triticum urartu]